MKVIFVGPSAPEITTLAVSRDVEPRPPAAMGDVLASVVEGATVIGLVDGTFANNPAVRHKEILYALSRGVRVFGGGSMGALRAAECAPYGMVGIGSIFRRYAAGDLIDDDAVALLHAPKELGYAALTEPLVNIEATCVALRDNKMISAAEEHQLLTRAHDLYFEDRTLAACVANLERRDQVLQLMVKCRRDLKREDALAVLEAVAAASAALGPPAAFRFNETVGWSRLLERVREQLGGA